MKKTIKKITTRSVETTTQSVENAAEPVKEDPTGEQKSQRRWGCSFCQSKQIPSYFDIATLKRFLSERGKILPKGYTKACSKHQRGITRHIKYARHLSLLPFTPKV